MTNDFIMALEMSFLARYSNVQLTLPQIERRMNLFPEWLDYYINEKYFDPHTPKNMAEDFLRTGFMCYRVMDHKPAELLTFDKWLIFTGHHELAINQHDRPKVATGLFHQQLLEDWMKL